MVLPRLLGVSSSSTAAATAAATASGRSASRPMVRHPSLLAVGIAVLLGRGGRGLVGHGRTWTGRRCSRRGRATVELGGARRTATLVQFGTEIRHELLEVVLIGLEMVDTLGTDRNLTQLSLY